MPEIAAFEAKTQFSRLLARTRGGETFTITHRGAPVARLVPVDDPDRADATRRGFAELRRLAKEREGEPIRIAEILEWIAEGRR